MTSNQILVGVDGSPQSDAAVVWAAAEAASRGARLNVVHASNAGAMNLWAASRTVRSELRAISRPLVDDAMRLAAKHQPTVPIRGRVLIGTPSRLLLLLAEQMDLTVIGRSGRGALARIWFGSVTERLVARACSPVVVVTHDPDTQAEVTARIVLGLDESPAPQAAVRFAFEQARRRHVPLCVIHAVRLEAWPALGSVLPSDVPPAAQRRQADALAPWIAKYPDVRVTSIVRVGRAADELLAGREGGDLIVLGHRRPPALAPRQLGTVAATVLHHAPCSVALVPELRPVAVYDQDGAVCVRDTSIAADQ